MRLELIRVDEGVDPHSAEEMADALSDLFVRNVLSNREGWGKGSPVGAREDAAEYVHHDRKAVAFVSASFAVGT